MWSIIRTILLKIPSARASPGIIAILSGEEEQLCIKLVYVAYIAMPPGLRSVTLKDSAGETVNADNVIGIDESGSRESGPYVTVAARCNRESDIDLVELLIENDLQPFEHKSSSIVNYNSLSVEERNSRVSNLLSDLSETAVTWCAIVFASGPSEEEQATAAAMCIKKSITHGLQINAVPHGCGDTAAIHDGARDKYSDYPQKLRRQLSSCCDSSFQRSICPVHLTYLQEAEFIYPQTTVADYIAGYVREKYENEETPNHDWVYDFDSSWIDPAPQPDPIYNLKNFQPVRQERLQSRVIAWLRGEGIPQSPQPRGRNPYRELVDEIENERVCEYLKGLG